MTVLDKLKETLEGIDIRFDEPLKSYAYTRVGGKADYLVFPRNRYEMARVVKFANQENIPWMVLGNASNIIVREGCLQMKLAWRLHSPKESAPIGRQPQHNRKRMRIEFLNLAYLA